MTSLLPAFSQSSALFPLPCWGRNLVLGSRASFLGQFLLINITNITGYLEHTAFSDFAGPLAALWEKLKPCKRLTYNHSFGLHIGQSSPMKNHSLTLCPSLAITTSLTFYSKPDWLEKFLLHHCLMNVFLIHSSTHSHLVCIKNTTGTALRKPLKVKVKVTQLCPTLCNPMDYIYIYIYRPWNSPGQNTGVGSLYLL